MKEKIVLQRRPNPGLSIPSDNAPVFDIPKECKAGVIVNEGPDFHVEVQMVPVPEPGPDELLIRLNVTGICFSVIHFAKANLGTPLTSTFGVRSPGHEGAGVVVKVGSNVRTWKVGERAGMNPRWSTCGDCELCLDDMESYCRKSVLCGLHKPGYVTSPAHHTQRIPDGVAAAMGFRPIVVDTGEARRELALARGAVEFVDFKEVDDPVAEVVRIADGVGAHGPEVMVGADPKQFITQGLTVRGSAVIGPADIAAAPQFAAAGKISGESKITNPQQTVRRTCSSNYSSRDDVRLGASR
ncbi:chaperonin 10-like protein [Aspergillus karnatakaensis]|uniref:chaperonin 10-like protein n=1 Tax=Aspergillus karnatakaensis TaxID=1810916 RepID=UPI003CCDA03B